MLYGQGAYKYEVVEHWAKIPGGMEFGTIGALTTDAHDNVYVHTRGKHPMLIFDCHGNFLSSWESGPFKSGHGVKVGPDGSVYCVDRGNHAVTKFDRDGQLLMTLGTRDVPSDTGYTYSKGHYDEGAASIKQVAGPFNTPTDIAIHPTTGEMFVTDGYGNARVHKFAPDGTLIFSWGKLGHTAASFIIPHGIHIDHHERVWVADKMNHRIQVFTTQGEYLDQWPVMRPQRPWLDDAETTMYVTELEGISIFTPDGRKLAHISNKREEGGKMANYFHPGSHALDSQGNLYVAGRGAQGIRVVKFERKYDAPID